MSLFKKKKEEAKEPACCCGATEPGGTSAEEQETATCCNENAEGIYCVKVLGAGCKSCHVLYENVCKAVKDVGLNLEVEYVTDMEKIMSYGVMQMPALVVNEQVVSMGKVLKEKEVWNLMEHLST